MTDCAPSQPPFEPTNPPVLQSPGSTILVLDSEQPMVRTSHQETDAIGAMRRALKEYLSRAEKDVAGERVRLVDVFEEWAEPEDDAVRYPSAAVLLADGTWTYDAHAFAPTIYPGDQLPDGRYVVKVSEATAEFLVEVHCSNPGSRLAVSMLLEETLNPVDWMYGFQLDCPYYFGQRAEFSLASGEAPDDAASARHGLRPLKVKLSGHISVVRPRALPLAQPQLVVAAITVGTFEMPSPIAGGRR